MQKSENDIIHWFGAFALYMSTVTSSDALPSLVLKAYEQRREKTGLWGFRPGLTQTGLYSPKRWLKP